MGQDVEDVEQTLRSAARSGNQEAQMETIRFLNAQGRPEEAVQTLQSFSGLGNSLVALLTAETEFYLGNLDKARVLIQNLAPDSRSEWIGGRELLIRMEFLEGRPRECRGICQELLASDPHNRTARLFLARSLQRFGDYESALSTLEAAAVAQSDDMEILETQASILDMEGATSEALALRKSLIPKLNASPPRSAAGMTAATEAMRLLEEPHAANQCLQLAQRYWPADPFVVLEKVRLARETYGFDDAAATAQRLLKRYKNFALARHELAEVLFLMRKNPTIVSQTSAAAIAQDPTLLEARCRLAFFETAAGNWNGAEQLLSKNKEYNPKDLQTQRMMRGVSLLRQGLRTPLRPDGRETTTSLDLPMALIMGEMLTAQEDYESAAAWFRFILDKQPGRRAALRGAGHAAFRLGRLEDAANLLDLSFKKNRFDLQTKNTLDLLDAIHAGAILSNDAKTSGRLSIGYTPRTGSIQARYAVHLAEQAMKDVEARLGLPSSRPLRIQLCDSRGDTAAASEGIAAFGCGSCSSGVLGSVNFNSIAFLWTPKGAGGLDHQYRFDEAIIRSAVLHSLRSIPEGKIPVWMREGLAGYIAARRNPELAPVMIDSVIAYLRMVPLPIQQLDVAYIGEAHPLCRVYGWMIVQEWADHYGEESLRAILERLRRGEDWKTAVYDILGKSIESIDVETRQAILDRYKTLQIPPPSHATPTPLSNEPNIPTPINSLSPNSISIKNDTTMLDASSPHSSRPRRLPLRPSSSQDVSPNKPATLSPP